VRGAGGSYQVVPVKLSMANIRRFRNLYLNCENWARTFREFNLIHFKACAYTYRKMLHNYLFQINNKYILKIYYQENILCKDNRY